MNCTYHTSNPATVSCNCCGAPLCPACDHRIRGFPFCQDCIVSGVELLRSQRPSESAPFVAKKTSPVAAALLSMLCPGLGAAYNGQTVKAAVHFAVFVGLFQMAVLTSGTPLFVLGFIGIWLFAALDSWRTAQMIRSGLTPDVADDILVKRFSGNPKLWGVVLVVLGSSFLLQRVIDLSFLIRGILPVALIFLGVYVLKGLLFKPSAKDGTDNIGNSGGLTYGSASFNKPNISHASFADRTRSGGWKDV